VPLLPSLVPGGWSWAAKCSLSPTRSRNSLHIGPRRSVKAPARGRAPPHAYLPPPPPPPHPPRPPPPLGGFAASMLSYFL